MYNDDSHHHRNATAASEPTKRLQQLVGLCCRPEGTQLIAAALEQNTSLKLAKALEGKRLQEPTVGLS